MELVHAAVAVPLILCGEAEFPIVDAEKILPRNTCPLIKSSFGFKISRLCPYFQSADLLVGETICGGKKKIYELQGERVPTYVLHLHHKMDDAISRNLWFEAVKKFKGLVEELTGRRITDDKLRKAIDLANRKREALARVYNTRKADPVPSKGTHIRHAHDHSQLEAPHDTIEKSGAVVVTEESCTGTRYFTNLVNASGASTTDDLIKSMAEKYLNINRACFTPNNERPADVVRLAKE